MSDKINEISLPPISHEQQLAINNIKQGYNIKVDSVAGSGKTTTILHLSDQNRDKNILLLTYNKKLKLETQEKRDKLELFNLEVHSYHAFGVKYYYHKCHIDSGIIKVIENNYEPKTEFKYDIIILDEAQDITDSLYKFVRKIYNDNNTEAQIAIIGDKYQSIYKFRKADERFITFAGQIFNFNNIEFKESNLSTSYRLTDKVADFINDIVLKEHRINVNKSSHSKVIYAVVNVFNPRHQYFREMFKTIEDKIKLYGENEVFILAPSIKSKKSPVIKLANMLSKKGYSLYIPINDEQIIDDKVAENKILISTYHQSKGLERDFVVVFEFSDSYIKFYNRSASYEKCSNEQYVALTRCKQELMVVQHNTNKPLPFIDIDRIYNYVDFIDVNGFIKSTKLPDDFSKVKTIEYDIVDITSYLPSETLLNCMNYIKKNYITEEKFNNVTINYDGKYIDIPTKIKIDNKYEMVNDINSIAIYSYFEIKNNKTLTIMDALKKKGKDYADFPKTKKLSDLLLLSSQYSALSTGYIYKLNQIKDYNWMDKNKFIQCYDRLYKLLKVYNPIYYDMPAKTTFCTDTSEIKINEDNKIYKLENNIVEYEIEFPHKIGEIILTGKIDVLMHHRDSDNRKYTELYELKTTEKLTDTHFVQCALYALLYEMELMKLSESNSSSQLYYKLDTNRKYYLYNILSDEKYELLFDYERIYNMASYLIKEKTKGDKKISDEDFLSSLVDSSNVEEPMIEELIDEPITEE